MVVSVVLSLCFILAGYDGLSPAVLIHPGPLMAAMMFCVCVLSPFFVFYVLSFVFVFYLSCFMFCVLMLMMVFLGGADPSSAVDGCHDVLRLCFISIFCVLFFVFCFCVLSFVC